MTDYRSTREGYGDALLELGENDPNIVVVCADLIDSTGTRKFAEKFPERTIEVGVAEQNLAGVAAGLAMCGKTVFMASYAAFSPGRNYDFIRTQICFSNAHVKIIGGHAGFSAGPDGATHQMLEDVAMMRVLPNMTVLSPCDYWEAKNAVLQSVKITGPVYIRLHREATPDITTKEQSFEPGRWAVIKDGSDVCIIAHGPVINEVIQAGERLAEKNVSVKIINGSTIKPLDEFTLLQVAESFNELYVVEEHQKAGGLGSAICEFLSFHKPTKITVMGADNTFGASGKYAQLLEKYQVDRKSVYEAVIKSEHTFIKEVHAAKSN